MKFIIKLLLWLDYLKKYIEFAENLLVLLVSTIRYDRLLTGFIYDTSVHNYIQLVRAFYIETVSDNVF